MDYIKISDATRAKVKQFLIEQWYSTKMVVRGKEYDLSIADGILAIENANIVGLITYIVTKDVCEIMSLDSLEQSKGIGTRLVEEVIKIAKEQGCRKVVLITTNDNINALRFYQKRGFDMVQIYHNALERSRRLKPEIPLIGDNDIPLRHEIEFQMDLLNDTNY